MNELNQNIRKTIINNKIRLLKKKHEEELEDAIKLAKAEDIFQMHFGDEDYYKYIKASPHCAYGDYFVALEVKTLNEAILIAERENPLPCYLSRKGGIRFQAEGYTGIGRNEIEEDAECIGGYWFETKCMRQYPQKNYLNFWIRISAMDTAPKGEYLIRVQMLIEEFCYPVRANIKFDQHGNARRIDCNIDMTMGYFTHRIKMWSSEEHPNNYYLY